MTKHINFITRVATLAILIAASSGASAGISLSVTPSTQTITAGSLTTIDIRIDGLGAGVAPSLGAYDVDLTFNPAVLSFVSAAFGDGVLGNQLDLFGLGNVSSLTESSGMVNLFELSLDTAADINSLQAAEFVLASLRFSGLSGGTSLIGLSVNVLGDADGAHLAASLSSGSVVVTGATGVPEPATYTLVLAAFALIRTVRKRGLNQMTT